MASQPISAFIDLESRQEPLDKSPAVPTAPKKAISRTYHAVPGVAEIIDLESFPTASQNNVQSVNPESLPASGHQTPRTPAALSRTNSFYAPQQVEVEVVPSWYHPYMNRWRVLTACMMNFANGLNDSAPGALLPYMEKYYSIGYAVVSLIFITNAMGFILAAFLVDGLRAHFGRAKTLLIAQILIICGYIPILCTPPFPVVVVTFFLLGLGMAINLSLNNVFVANLQNGTTMLGAMHGSYGIGGTIAPLIATAMVTTGNLLWSRFYILPMGMAILNAFLGVWAFWHFEKEAAAPTLLTSVERMASQTNNLVRTQTKTQFSDMLHAFKSRAVLLGSLFIFCYQGAEVSISGWVISFLISDRDGNPSAVGYVTAGFWGGITIGRLFLSPAAHKIGEKAFVYGIVIGSAVFELCVWLVPNVIGDAVAVSLVGLLLGPVYPCATVVFSRLIGRKEQVSSLSVISAFGSSGGALAPFTTGILAQAVGTFVLNPIAIALFAVMMVCWFSLPKVTKRSE